MNHAANGTGHSPAALSVTVELFRVKSATSTSVRTLSEDYGGLFTHYLRDRSQYCPGDAARCPTHKLPRFWKGYAAIERFDPVAKLWIPTVLEITEHLELEFRGRFARGQGWVLSREPDEGKKKKPVMAKFVKDVSLVGLRPAFNYVPVLKTIFHVEEIDTRCANPLPPKIILEVMPHVPDVADTGEDRKIGGLDDWRKKMEQQRRSTVDR